MVVNFENGNSYSYRVGLRRPGYEAVYNLLEWTVGGQTFTKRFVQGVDTTREMWAAKARAYSEAAGAEYVVSNGVFVKA